ncbi:MAG: GAP family protein [Patescibacteria group bacterium]
MDNLTIPILVGAAIVDSINPCAFGVLFFLLAYLFKNNNSKKLVLLHGFLYITAVFLTYLLAGLFLLPFLSGLGGTSQVIYIFIGSILVIFGLLEIKDFFFYGKGFSLGILPSASKRIQMMVQHIEGKLSTSFILGIFVALVELPCTGVVYLGVLALVSLSGLDANNFLLLVLYNFLFVLPLIVILILVSKGNDIEKLEEWRKKHRGLMRLAIGTLLIIMGAWMINFVI